MTPNLTARWKVATNGSAKEKPLDNGLAFAWYHRRSLFLFALPPIVLEIISSYQLYNFPVNPTKIFLYFMLHMAASTWLLVASGLFVFESFKGQTAPNVLRIALTAVKILPKPYLSYLGVTFVFFTVIALRYTAPLVLLVAFLLWAPFFCIFEYCADSRDRRNGKARGGSDDEDMGATYLQRKMPWELGFARSIKCASDSTRQTFSVALLLLASEILPNVLVSATVGDAFGFGAHLLRIVLGSLVNVLMLGAAGCSFVLLLPRAAKSELFGSQLPEFDFMESVKSLPGFRFEGRLVPHFALFGCILLALLYLQQSALDAGSIPESAIINVESAEIRDNRLVTTLYLDDQKNKFRWFDADRFRLEFPRSPQPERTSAEVNSASGKAPNTTAPDEPLIQSPERVQPEYADGGTIQSEYYVPTSRALRIVLYFKIPDGAVTAGDAVLHYATLAGLGEGIANISYGDFK